VGDDAPDRGQEAPPQLGVGDHGQGAADPGQVVGFAGGKKGDGALGHLGAEGGDGNVGPVPVQDQAAVDFVGTYEQPPPQAELGQGFEFGPVQNPAGGVVGVAEEEEAGTAGGGFQGLRVEDPAARFHPHGGGRRLPAHGPGSGEEGRVDGNGGEHGLPRFRQAAYGVESADQPGEEDQPVGGDVPAGPLPQLRPHRLHQPGAGNGVPEDPVVDPVAQGPADGRRRGEIHVRHPQGDDVGAGAAPPFFAPGPAPLGDGVEIRTLLHGR